jgi:hypothetical protein
VIAQVNAIMGEDVTIVENTPEAASESTPRTPIAPLITQTKAPKRESLAAIDLPSFPKRDR